jgi:hypothetical protein
MAKRSSKGPRRPKIRAVIGVARPVVRPPTVVHHVHHAGPSMRAMAPAAGLVRRPFAGPGLVAPVLRPGRNTAFPRPPVGPMGGPMGGPVGVPRPPIVPGAGMAPGAPPVGPFAPRAPIPGPMGPMGPLGPRRY